MTSAEQLNNAQTPQHNAFRDADASRQREEGSLSVESNKSYRSMITPSPEPMALDDATTESAQTASGSTLGISDDTMAHTYSMDVLNLEDIGYDVSLMHSSEFSLNLNTPTKKPTKKRKAEAPPEEPARLPKLSKHNKENKHVSTDLHEATGSFTRARARATSRRAVARARASDQFLRRLSSPHSNVPRTPDKLFQLLRPSGSPTRVSGSKVVADVNFTDADYRGLCKVDKSLVCKGFWESIEKVGRICLPRRSGKTYNMTQMLLFFSILPEAELVEAIPDNVLVSSGLSAEQLLQMSVADRCRIKREWLFKDSLMQTMDPQFYQTHFMKYPVLQISLSECKGETLGEFIVNLCGCLAVVATSWIKSFAENGASGIDNMELNKLRRALDKYEEIRYDSSDKAVVYAGLVQSMFKNLSEFISSIYGRYILLIDEYDVPFISINLADWDARTKKGAQGILKLLFQTMFKDNRHLQKGLLFGVFEIPLTELGSGANNIKEIRMIPTEESDIQSSILSASHPHSGSGLDALTDSFWFNANEVELMLDQSAKTHPVISTYKPCIMATIKDWYNGYYIGRFRGKYNPWSVSSFIETLCSILSQTPPPQSLEQMQLITQSAARAFWVTTGTTGLIEAQIDKYRSQFVGLAKRLLSDYESFKATDKTPLHKRAVPVPLVATRLNLINYDSEQFSEPGLLTLCLYAGYLTRRESTSVCIPNHEVYQVWLQLFARAVMGTEMADNSANYMRGSLLQELLRGQTNLLSTLAISSHGVLSNHNSYKEKDYANHVANTLMAVSRFGMLTHPDQKSVSISHVVPIREGHTGVGRCDYAMRLFGSDNQPNRFGVIIEFKLIENHRREDSAYHGMLAEEGLQQISDKNYESFLLGCLERMDVGMAIGNNVVHTKCQLFRRDCVDSPWYPVDSLVDDQANQSFV
ncbi:hypothetical protein H4R99_000142 [Coemansia sp. RSA 1722]|nr:hypothetical protein IWW45_001576 [Coemansia sp. RSA 485]KAJ2606716.1 hypothetical protein H4R99_000142 [Coemansia sp. RSA 1722]